MLTIKEFIASLPRERPVYLQTHNYPDHDAVASGFGFQYILSQFGISSRIIYDGDIQRESLLSLISRLKIDIKDESSYLLENDDKIIIVDGCKGNKNVTDLVGEEIGFIDHHEVRSPDNVLFVDIRFRYGSCSSIIFTYFRDLALDIPRDVASALLAGLLVDTDLMTRKVSEADIEAYVALYSKADVQFVNSNLRNNIQVKDLDFYRKAIEKVRITKRVAFCYFEDGCNQNLMGILGDFFLSVSEIDVVILCAKNDDVINFSLRNEVEALNAAAIVQELLQGIGFGGGHADMAGGIVKDIHLFDEESFYKKIVTLSENIFG
jgi:nanoRNase/pAp phosphatase (c-di-AMP/oligoRNAs hydrolase)